MNANTNQLSIINRLALVLVSVFICWKLLRLISPSPYFWGLHLYILAAALIISLLISLNSSIYKKSNTSLPVTSILFGLFVFLAIIRSLIFDSFYDVYFVSAITFGLYFLFLKISLGLEERKFFAGIDYLMALILLINFTQLIDINFLETGLYFYGEMPKFIGDMGLTDHRVRSFIPFNAELGLPPDVVRVSGVSGSAYASSALVAAIGIYSYVIKNKKLFYFALLQLLLFSVLTSLLVFMGFLLFLNRKNLNVISLLVITFPFFAFFVMKQRGVDEIAPWLDNTLLYTDFSQFTLALVFGEGRWNPQVNTEIRYIEDFFSFGIIGTAIFLIIMLNYNKFIKSSVMIHYHHNYYYASWMFILVLFLTTFHYHTFFIFPNLLFVIFFIAFAAARNNKIPLDS